MTQLQSYDWDFSQVILTVVKFCWVGITLQIFPFIVSIPTGVDELVWKQNFTAFVFFSEFPIAIRQNDIAINFSQ